MKRKQVLAEMINVVTILKQMKSLKSLRVMFKKSKKSPSNNKYSLPLKETFRSFLNDSNL